MMSASEETRGSPSYSHSAMVGPLTIKGRTPADCRVQQTSPWSNSTHAIGLTGVWGQVISTPEQARFVRPSTVTLSTRAILSDQSTRFTAPEPNLKTKTDWRSRMDQPEHETRYHRKARRASP